MLFFLVGFLESESLALLSSRTFCSDRNSPSLCCPAEGLNLFQFNYFKFSGHMLLMAIILDCAALQFVV